MRKRALIIGVSSYDKLEELPFCETDGNSMYEVLKQSGYEIPDYNKLTGYIKWEKMRLTSYEFFVDHSILDDDILVYYFSGHGIQDINGDMYLAPSEIEPDSPYKNGFSFAELTKMAQNSKAKKVVLILDCCYSGSATISRQFETASEGICLLAASQPYEEASVLAEKNHSVYTYYLLHGLEGKDADVFDHSGNITVDTLSSYIYRKIKSLPLEKRPGQRPLRKIESSGDIILIDSDHFPKLNLANELPEKTERQRKTISRSVASEDIARKLSPGVVLNKTEQTFRSEFISILRESLSSHGLDLKDEIRVTISGAQVRFPDVLILERGRYRETGDLLSIYPGGLKAIIETKHPKKYSSVGFTKLIEYCKLILPDVGFVTNFKDLIEYRLEDQGHPSVTPINLGSIADNTTFRKIAGYILQEIKNPPTKLKQISDDDLVKVLQNYLAEIQSYFTGDVSGLAETLGIFKISDDKELFKPEEQHKPDIQDLIRKAASFVILNQIIFYIALERNTSLVEQVENLSSFEELQSKFDFVSEVIDYKAVFGAKVVLSLPNEALETINALISNLEALNFYNIKREILGKIYHNLIPMKIRKRIAAYYTSNTACELLARLTIEKENDNVLDPSCGSGGFLVAAYKIKKELSKKSPKHRNLIQSLYGFDISTFASHLSVINLTIQDLRDSTNEVYVTVDDAFNQGPSKSIELLKSNPTQSLIATAQGVQSKMKILPEFDVVLMNPPFTRIERLEENYKRYLTGKTGIFRDSMQYFKGQSGLHCFFLVHIKRLLKEGGLFGAVLPISTFSSEYGNELKPFILDNYRIIYLLTYEKQTTFSVDCVFKEVLLVGVKGSEEARKSWQAKVIVLKEQLELDQIKSLSNQFKAIETDVDSERYSIRIVSKQEFKSEWNWATFTRPKALKKFIDRLDASKFTDKQANIIQFHEGYHLDGPSFFRLPNEYWNKEQDGEIFVTFSEVTTGRTINILKRYLIPTLDVPENHSETLATMNKYILSIPPNEKIPDDLRTYIEWGENVKKDEESKKIPQLYKILNYSQAGNRWYTYGHHILSRHGPENNLIGSRLAMVEKFGTKSRTCIVLFSKEKLTGSNSYFFGNLDSVLKMNKDRQEFDVEEDEEILASWFSSTLFLALYVYYRREISGDYGRIKIGDMKNFPCINPTIISKKHRNSILRKFRKINSKKIPWIYEQLKTKMLKELDMSLLESLGINLSSSHLDNLYDLLLKELDKTEADRLQSEEDKEL